MNNPKICAFAICATGERYIPLRDHLREQLQWYAPGVDIVDIDLGKVRACIGNVNESELPAFARLAIPLLDQFKKYERVVYIDVDTDIKSGQFLGILDVETSGDGLAACADAEQQKRINYLKSYCPEWAHVQYVQSGVLVMDLDKIDSKTWQQRVSEGLAMHAARPFLFKDQDVINVFFECALIDRRFNCVIALAEDAEKEAAWLWHYAGGLEPKLSTIGACERKYSVVFLPAGDVIRWLRSYFAIGVEEALVVVGTKMWSADEKKYAKATIEFCGGVLIDGQGREVSDAEIRQTLDNLKITQWKYVEADVDLQNNPLLNQGAYPPAPFESMIDAMAQQVKAVEVKLPRPSDDGAIDAVFVIGTGSPNDNEELRYALRNLAKHCPFIRDVYISGECPSWVDKTAVKHLQWPDRFKHAKDANIIDKLRHACEQKGIAKRILFCSDDQFQTHVCKWEDFFPRYLRQYRSDDTWYADCKRTWHTRLRDTLERDKKRREAAKLDPSHVFYYEPHMWMQIDRDKFIEYAKWSDYEHRSDTIIASGYFNYIDADGHPHDDKYDHVFMSKHTKTLPTVTQVAYTDGGFKKAKEFFNQLFPDKCRFEIGGAAVSRPEISLKTQNGEDVCPAPDVQKETVRRVVQKAAVVSVARVIDKDAIRAAICKRIFGKIGA